MNVWSWVAIAVILLVVALGARGARAGTPVSTQSAAESAARTQLIDARSRLAEVFKADPDNAEGLFILACVELEAAHLDAAAMAITKLASRRGDSQEVRVLRALTEQRRKEPAGSWMTQFLQSVRSAGATDPDKNLLRYVPNTVRPLDAEKLAALPGGDGFLVRSGEAGNSPSESLVREAIDLAGSPQPIEIQLTVLGLLDRSKVPPSMQAAAKAAASALIKRLALDYPREMDVQGLALLHGTAGALTSEEVTRLEAIADMKFITPMNRLYEAFRHAYEKVDPGQAHQMGFTSVFGPYPTSFHVLLHERSQPLLLSNDRSLRVHAGMAFSKIARSFAGRGSLLELSIARMLMRRAADLADDGMLRTEADALQGSFSSTQASTSMKAVTTFVAEFPLASLQHELTDMRMADELKLYRILGQ